MFLELHLLDDNTKILLNIQMIQCIGQAKGITYISYYDSILRVKESYEDVVEAINNWDRLTKA